MRYFLVGIILLINLFLPSSIVAEENEIATQTAKVDSYDLFWPIVAGKVSGEPFYQFKLIKESLLGLFSFGDFKRVDYKLSIAEKRVIEAEKLYLAKKDYLNGRKTIVEAQQKNRESMNIISKAIDAERSVVEAMGRFSVSIEKQVKLLSYISLNVPNEEKQLLEDTISLLNDFSSQLQ